MCGAHGGRGDIKEEITEAVQIVDVPIPQCHEDIVEVTAVRSVGVAHDTHWSSEENGSRVRASGLSSLMMGVTTCSSIVNSWLRQARHREDTVSCDAEYDDHRGHTGSDIHWCRWHA